MKSLIVLLPYLLIAAAEMTPLLKRRLHREAAAVGVLSGLGGVYAVGVQNKWPVPNPAVVIESFVGPLARWAGLL